jgi:hypothetical protein
VENQYNHDIYNEDAANNEVHKTFIPTFVCPSEPQGGFLEVPVGGPANASNENLQYRSSSYKAVAGSIGSDDGLRD